jgi:dephospho-CoA kinase
MPATSQQQQKLFGLALSVKRGETSRNEASDEVLNIVDTMSEKDIEDFASTSHSGLPKKVESIIRGFVRETLREKVLSEATPIQKIFRKIGWGGDGWTPQDYAKQIKNLPDSTLKIWYDSANSNNGIPNTPLAFQQKLTKIEMEKRGLLETVNEEQEQLDEKLITFSNRAPYGQVVFIAGGAGSGKGFAIENFIDSAGYKVRDVDEMKKQIQKLNAIGKLSIQQIIDKFGRNIAPKDMDIIKQIQDDGYDLKSMNLKNPNHVYALHILVDSMGIKDKTLENMLAAKSNPETLPNIIFDITAKKITSITEVLPMLHSVGYKPNNIHLVWILTDYDIAIKQNAERSRVVPADIMLDTHIGAGNTVWGMVTSALPKGMNGRVDVILNNQQNTVFFIQRTTDKKTGQKKAVVSGFLALPVKKQGGPILPEKIWKDTLYNWIKDNGPKELTANFS